MAPEHVGKPLKRIEDPGLLTGRDPYVADVPLPPDALTMALARSPLAHARIVTVDTAAARAMPGVAAVLTGADLNETLGDIPMSIPEEAFDQVSRRGRYVLAHERVRCVGEPVAVVLAADPGLAADAAEAIAVRYEPLPVVADPEAALEPGSPLLYEPLGTNLALRWKREAGDVEAAFGRADVVVEARLVNQRVIPLAMEPRACSAVWHPDTGLLTVWGDTQVPHRLRDTLARYLGLAPEQVHLMTARVGGGFGAKIPLYPEDLLVPYLARRLGRPVRWVATRREDIQATTHGRDMRAHLRLAAGRDGRVLALDARIIGNVGYTLFSEGPILPVLCAQMLPGCYDIRTARIEAVAAFTNTMGTGAYRGAGRPEAAYFIERMMALLARRLDLDPAEVRRRNYIRPEQFPYTTVTGHVYDSGAYAATLQHALDTAGYPRLRADQAARRRAGRLVGIGLASYVEICGFNDEETSDVSVEATGRVTVLTGSASHGQGHETAYAQLVADELGISPDLVDVVHGDTARVRSGAGTFGSRSLARGGMHAVGNARRVREKATRIAAHLLEASPADVVRRDGGFQVRGAPHRILAWTAVAAAAHAGTLPAEFGGGLESREDLTGAGTLFPFGSHVAVVEVDPETGQVRLLRYVSVDDSGLIVNPLLAQGQVHGGLAQGIGQALLERAVHDEQGQLVSGSLMDYAIPKADDLVAFENDHTRTLSPRTPLGVKGIGESATIGSTPAIAEAVLDALAPLGVERLDIPLTPDRVWDAIRERRRR
jgi:carbon-monoxide dehydrogenase large subunit